MTLEEKQKVCIAESAREMVRKVREFVREHTDLDPHPKKCFMIDAMRLALK